MKIDATYDHDRRHGGAYDRGGADYHYGRKFDPHYFIGNTFKGIRIGQEALTDAELSAYKSGWSDAHSDGDIKKWY